MMIGDTFKEKKNLNKKTLKITIFFLQNKKRKKKRLKLVGKNPKKQQFLINV